MMEVPQARTATAAWAHVAMLCASGSYRHHLTCVHHVSSLTRVKRTPSTSETGDGGGGDGGGGDGGGWLGGGGEGDGDVEHTLAPVQVLLQGRSIDRSQAEGRANSRKHEVRSGQPEAGALKALLNAHFALSLSERYTMLPSP